MTGKPARSARFGANARKPTHALAVLPSGDKRQEEEGAVPAFPWHLVIRSDGREILVPEDGGREAIVLLTSYADFLGIPIEVAVTDRGLFAKTSCGWGMVEAWGAESVPEALAHALR